MDVRVGRSGVVKFSDVSRSFPVDGVVTTRIFWPDFSFLKGIGSCALRHLGTTYPVFDSLLFELGVSEDDSINLLKPSLEHGNAVSFVGNYDHNIRNNYGIVREIPGDGIILQERPRTTRKNILLCLSADCPSAVIVAENKRSKKERCFGILHLGWKPLVKGEGIIAHAARILERHDCSLERCRVLITVGIGPCCYEVKEDVVSLFERHLPRSRHSSVYKIPQRTKCGCEPQLSIDLREAAYHLFRQAGVPRKGIHIMAGCTCCSKGLVNRNFADRKNDFLWPSYRRDATEERFAIAFAV